MKKIMMAVLFAFAFISCNKENSYLNSLDNDGLNSANKLASTSVISSHITCGTPTITKLLAGKFTEAGTVNVSNDETNLYITINTIDGWELRKTHIFAGLMVNVPLKNGNPQNGLFPYKSGDLQAGTTSYALTIPLAGLPDDMIIAVHTEVVKVVGGTVIQSETGWGEGPGFYGKNWAMYFTYKKQTCPPPPTNVCYEETSETAWAAGSKYNTNGGGNWATYVAYEGVSKTVNLYAGQTNLAGTATLSPGQFTSYKGTATQISVDAANYYGIHLDVNKIKECEMDQ